VEFFHDGSRVLARSREMVGALIACDAKTPADVKRMPVRRTSGKYNIYNKIHRSSGTVAGSAGARRPCSRIDPDSFRRSVTR